MKSNRGALCGWCLVALMVLSLAASCQSAPAPSPTRFIDAPISTLLGKSRRAIEADMKPTGQTADGWTKYTATFGIRYQGDTAVEIRERRVPAELTCREAALWMGFNRAKAPRLEKKRCVWPHDDPRHGLGRRDASAKMDLEGRTFKVKLHR